jgi:hypothetical protein
MQTGSFAVADSVGPLITKAVLIERLAPGNDTLIISFSETVEYTTVRENGLTLIKKQPDGTAVPVELVILKSQPDADGRSVVAIVKDLGTGAPREGDSLRITPSGPVADVSGNKAHPLNRPVVIITRKVPPAIVSARYEDRNADGMVETIVCMFNKSARGSDMKISVKWNNAVVQSGDASRIRFIGDSTVEVSIGGLFTDAVVKNRTSGMMNVGITFSGFETDSSRSAVAADAAAPVLTWVEYRYGRPVSADSTMPDTVFARFTEMLKEAPLHIRPLLFSSGAGVPYSIEVSYKNIVDGQYCFVVTKKQEGILPADLTTRQPGDSAWINTEAALSDNSGNVQSNTENKRVAISVKLPPFDMHIDVRPNPFMLKSGEAIITLTALAGVSMPSSFEVSAVIVDKVGNVVKRIPEDDRSRYGAVVRGSVIAANTTCKLFWNGTNRQGRYVGMGTYLVFIRTASASNPSDVKTTTIPVGVGLK